MTETGDTHNVFPPWLVPAKAVPDRQHISLTPRKELIRQLNTGLEGKLTVITAPAGYGKSTLMGLWRNVLQDRGGAVAWLCLDEDDNDPVSLATYLVFALSEAGFSEPLRALYPTGFHLAERPKTVLGIISAVLAKTDEKLVFILDGLEKLENPVIKEIISPLIRHSPENLHLAITSQTKDKLPLSDLKFQGMVNEITMAQMKFTPFEIEEFLGEHLSRKMLNRVGQKTEGWPVALQLVKTALLQNSDHKKFIDGFKGDQGDLKNYISERVLGKLSPSQKDFLLDISILEQIDADRIDYIRNTQNSRLLLDELKSLELLCVAPENSDGGYRLHPLLREALLSELAHLKADHLKTLHLRAADLFMEKDHLIQSIRHALSAEAPQRAADILEKVGGPLLWSREGISRVRMAHDLLPVKIVESRPLLYLLRALVLFKEGHINDARHIYNRVCHDMDKPGNDHSDDLEYSLVIIATSLAIYEGTSLSEEMSKKLLAPLERISANGKDQAGFICTVLCLFNLQKGNFTEARKAGEKAIIQFQKEKSYINEAYIYIHFGVMVTAQGDLEAAWEYFLKVQNYQRYHFPDNKDMRVMLGILMAEWHYERNDLSAAARLLKDVNRNLETGEAWYEIYAAGYTTSTALAYLQKGLEVCLNLMEEATHYIRQEGLKRINRLVMANKIGYLCRAGKHRQARRIVQEINLTFEEYAHWGDNHPSVREWYGVIQALTRLLIAEKRYEEALRELAPHLEQAQKGRTYQKFSILFAIAQYGAGDREGAFARLEKGLTFMRRQGFLRLLLDETPFVTALLKSYVHSKAAKEKDHARYLLDHLEPPEETQDPVMLSKRERQVLKQLSEGYSDKVIARNLEISENTVRFHLKNLFSKLDVKSRLMAVSVAEKLKFLK